MKNRLNYKVCVISWLLGAMLAVVATGCAEDDIDDVDVPDASSNPGSADADIAACADIAGTWSLSGTCDVQECMISQSGCDTSFVCNNGTVSFTGSVDGNNFVFTGALGSCMGAVNGDSMQGTCQGSGDSCTFSGQR